MNAYSHHLDLYRIDCTPLSWTSYATCSQCRKSYRLLTYSKMMTPAGELPILMILIHVSLQVHSGPCWFDLDRDHHFESSCNSMFITDQCQEGTLASSLLFGNQKPGIFCTCMLCSVTVGIGPCQRRRQMQTSELDQGLIDLVLHLLL